MSPKSVDDFVEEQSGREVAPTTMQKYGRWIKRFEAWRPKQPDEDVLRSWDSYLTDEDRIDYPWSNARGPSPPDSYSFQSRVVSLSGVKLWLKHEFDTHIETEVQNIAEGEPADFEPTTVKESKILRTINEADQACSNPDCRVAIKLGYDAILRGAELADVRAEDIDKAEQTLYVRAVKGSEKTNIKLSDDTFRAVRQHMAQHAGREHLFTNSYDNRWTASAWNQHFRRKHNDIGFHSYARHSAIVNRLREGEDLEDVFLRARHKSLATTLKYISMVPDREKPDFAEGML